MTLLDLAFILILMVFAAGGLDTGLVRQLLVCSGLVFGVVLGLLYSSRVANWLAPSLHALVLYQPLVFLAFVLICVAATSWLGARWQRRYAQDDDAAWADRFGGAILGLLGGLVVLGLACTSAAWLDPRIGAEIDATWVGIRLLRIGNYLVGLGRL